jgi:hypothetical protein
MVSVMRDMIDILKPFIRILASPFKTQARLEAEIILLRHQLNAFRRSRDFRRSIDCFLSGSIAIERRVRVAAVLESLLLA